MNNWVVSGQLLRNFFFQSNLDWFLELMGHIRSHLRRGKTFDGQKNFDDGFVFLFDVFVVAAIAFAESDTLVFGSNFCSFSCRSDRLSMLPSATAKLLINDQVKCINVELRLLF